MGIHGLLKELGPAPRTSLAKLSAAHYTTHSRPLRLAIDIQIWLFQIQSGKGGSNPALRTFYYRLLRLLSLNIWPLFVFDGPNKPLFKRNKKVGGPGVRVATVPEFLAKQLLKEFGFPWHIAPGEAEAECALLQREGVVDAVLSEDVDTLMFGSGVTLRNWTSEGTGSNKSPTHVSVYRVEETRERSKGVDREGMILVALMSGGDYLPEGIPGCGPKVACAAARAGFGAELCKLGKRDVAALKLWKERLQHQIRTNEAKYFGRKNSGFTMQEDFPNLEVLGYYTHPCVSTPEKVQKLRETLKWDLPIDYAALRSFAADAFDWRCLGGAQKFIKNLAPALLVRELRVRGGANEHLNEEAQEAAEKTLVGAVHGKRHHPTTDGELELRVSFTPATLVPIDLSIEDEDDDFLPAGGGGGDSDGESDFASLPPSSTATEEEDEAPKKKRVPKPFDPGQPEKLWILRTFVQVGCPLMVEEYEASFRDPKEFFKQRRNAKAAAQKGGEANIHAKPRRAPRKKKGDSSGMPSNALMAFAKVTKGGVEREVLKENSSQGNLQPKAPDVVSIDDEALERVGEFKMPSTQIPAGLVKATTKTAPRPSSTAVVESAEYETLDLSSTPRARPFARFADKPIAAAASAVTVKQKAKAKQAALQTQSQRTPPHRKRRSAELSSPALSQSQRSILSYYSPSPHKSRPTQTRTQTHEIIDLISSSPAKALMPERPLTPSPPNLRDVFVRSPSPTWNGTPLTVRPHPVNRAESRSLEFSPGKLPDTVTKRRRKGPLRRYQTAPVEDVDADELGLFDGLDQRAVTPEAPEMEGGRVDVVEAMDLASPSPARFSGGGGFLLHGDDGDGGDDEEEEEEEQELRSPTLLFGVRPPAEKRTSAALKSDARLDAPLRRLSPDYPIPPTTADGLPRQPVAPITAPAPSTKARPSKSTVPARASAPRRSSPKSSLPPTQPPRRSPRQAQKVHAQKKKALLIRQSLEGAWKEVDIDAVDMSGDGSGWKRSGGKAEILGGKTRVFRKSGVEVLDMTGA